ncbi:hypothetical protein [Methylotuvimicrobium buryatense]|uniref:Uncharacterized protein n=1 Tax=Methylotuvimicrobium buryatense TaxID=95641 RepID=A0A4P9UQ23_METBY|nr:hypothetical protein [Methylotuvimicrobium buryatense]QCW83519.1 hypothetical protein EQU24_15670 [Methylotuvimicrobium buryatense]
MQILQEQKSALPPTPVNRATEPPSNSCLSYFMLVPKLSLGRREKGVVISFPFQKPEIKTPI